MKKLFIVLTLFIATILIFTQESYAIDYAVGLNASNVAPFLDEYELDSSGTGYANYIKVSGLTETQYTIAWLDSTPLIEDDFAILAGAYFDDLEVTDWLTQSIQIYRFYTEDNWIPVQTFDINPHLFEINNDQLFDEPYVLCFQSSSMADVKTFVETYAYVIYDSAINILTKSIAYYSSLANSAGYAEGYDDGILVGTGTYSQGYYDGYDVGLIDGYEDGQNDLYDYGSTINGFILADSHDYKAGVTVGGATNVNAGMTNFMSDFGTWIVPAIIIIILLGGFVTIYAKKNRGD